VRILFVSPYPPAKDGIGTYTQAMINALRALGHQAAVVVPRPQPGKSPDVIGALNGRPDGTRALGDLVSAWEPDLIHVQFAVAAFGTQTRALLSWLRMMRSANPVPVVTTMHEVTRDTATLRGPGRALYRMLAANCDRVIVHTRGAGEALRGPLAVPPEKVTIVPHPRVKPPKAISTAADLRSHFGLGDAELLVAFGFIHVDKGLGDLIEALRLVNRSGDTALDGVRLVIAGSVRPRHGVFKVFEMRDRAHLARVNRKARRGGVDNLIVRTGYVPEADVAGWFQAASAIVLPYRRTEQSGVAGLADAYGVPVLASTAGGLGEQYEGSRWSFPPCDPSGLSAVLRRFLATAPADRGTTAGRIPTADLGLVVAATLDAYGLASDAVLASTVGSTLDAS
jgi:glycosyltransferase involved in cell wall biosynthesis